MLFRSVLEMKTKHRICVRLAHPKIKLAPAGSTCRALGNRCYFARISILALITDERLPLSERINSSACFKQVMLDYIQQFRFSKHFRLCSLVYTNRAYVSESRSVSHFPFSRVRSGTQVSATCMLCHLYI